MIGAVGDDMFRDLTLTTLAAEGIDVGGVRITDGATGIAHIRVDTASAQNDIMIIPNANHRLNPDDVEASLTKLGDRVSVVLVQLEIPVSVVQRVAEVCRALELRLVLDPAPAQPLPPEVWRGVWMVKPNELEAEALTGIAVTDLNSAELAARWFRDAGAVTAMITRGDRGAVVIGPAVSRIIQLFRQRRLTPLQPVTHSPARLVRVWLAAPHCRRRCGEALPLVHWPSPCAELAPVCRRLRRSIPSSQKVADLSASVVG
jgi:ribokinase